MKQGNRSIKSVAFIVLFSFFFLVTMGEASLNQGPSSEKDRGSATLSSSDEGSGAIEQRGSPAKTQVSKRKFPWLLVVFGTVAVAAAVYFFAVKKTRYTLAVTVGEGASGTPLAGSGKYDKGVSVDYNYWPASGYNFVFVQLDGQPVGVKGTITMDGDHTLEVTAVKGNASTQRVVVAEKFTATWCGYCPGAAMGMEELKNEVRDRLVIISYHSGDDYSVTSVYNARQALYGVSGIPDVYFDGVEHVLGGSATQSQYSRYKPVYDRRVAVAPLVSILLTASGSNAVNILVTNVTTSAVSGTLYVAIIENNIPCVWQNQSVLQFVCRAMLPNASGEPITLSSGQSVSKSRTFTLGSAWKRANCRIAAFVQGANKEIFQGAEIGI